VTIISASWLLGVTGFLLVSSIAVARIPIEERELAERFGDRWIAYRARTGALLPRAIPRARV
jgi:protein-S-isoprenylcysteine O-methyltransferase Ste14